MRPFSLPVLAIFSITVATAACLPKNIKNLHETAIGKDFGDREPQNLPDALFSVGKNSRVADDSGSSKDVEFREALSMDVEKIIGGHPAIPGENPYQVSIQVLDLFGSSHICGGAIITEFYVLTVAQCVTSQSESNLQVVAGDLSLSDTTGYEQVRSIETITVHPSYAFEQPQKNDIAIIKVPVPFMFDSMVSSIPLAVEDVTVGEECITTGWGSTSDSGSYADTLMEVGVLVLNDTQCEEVYGDEYGSDSMLCAGDLVEGKDFCQGDEGGPLKCGAVLQGLASWGVGCGRGNPGVYTRVYNFTEWIEEVIYDEEIGRA